METDDGRRVLDFTAGQICATLGHNHPRVVEAIERGLRDVAAPELVDALGAVLELAERLMAMLPEPLRRAMFLSTGGEANEAALRHGEARTPALRGRALTRSWHGVTAGAAARTYAAGRRGYGPAMPGTFALPAPYAYRCPIRHCRGRCDLTCLDAGFDLVDQASVGARGRGDRRAGAPRRRRSSRCRGLLRAR